MSFKMSVLRNIKNHLLIFKFSSQLISQIYTLKNLFFYGKLIVIKPYKNFYLHFTNYGIIPYFHPLSNAEKYLKENYKNFFLYYQLKNKDLVVEFGSGIGTEALVISKKIGKMGKIFCFEPNTEIFELLKLNKKQNKLYNSKLFKSAIYKKKTFIGFDNRQQDWIGGNININSKKKINSTTLNEFIKNEKIKKINFCKINIEGAEKYIIHNSDKFFKICENIAIECHDFLNKPEFKTKKLIKNFLKKKGYKIFNPNKNRYINFYTKYYIYAKKIKNY